MTQVASIAVGSIPLALVEEIRAGAFVVCTTPTRLQATDLERGDDMFAEFRRLADGEAFSGAEPDSGSVVKAQLPGPVTLLHSGQETLQTSIRRIRAAIDTLCEIHPKLHTLWLDEPMLAHAPNDWSRLLGHTLRALKAEYFDLSFGVHSCASLRSYDLSDVPADAWAFDLSRDLDAVVAAQREGKIVGQLIWSLVPTDGGPAALDATTLLRLHRSLQPDAPIVVSAACGLGARTQADARATLAQVEALRADIEAQLQR